MRNRVKIQNLVNSKMEDLIPDWSTLSPSDPLKVFFEGIVLSLAEIDHNTKRNLGTMLDMVPSLLAFYPKKPSLAKGLFQFDVKEHATSQLRIPKGLKLKYKAEGGKVNNILFDEQKIEPYKLISADRKEDKLTVKFQVYGQIEGITLSFLRSERKLGPSQLQKVIIKYTAQNEDVFLDTSDILIQDSTEGFTKTGQVKLTSSSRPFPNDKYILTVEFDNMKRANAGDVYTNLAIGNICQIVPETSLGFLQGEIWEEVKLPQNILAPPKKLSIELPTGESFELKLAESEILKIKEYDLNEFTYSFLYNGIQHSLIIPNAEILLQNKLGGAEIKVHNLIHTVNESAFPTKDTKISLEGLEGTIQEITPLAVIAPEMERENKEQFLSRFSKTISKFYSYSSNTLNNFSDEELKSNILNFEPSVRSVEVHSDELTDIYQIYILSFNPYLHKDKEIDLKVIDKVQEHVTKLAPLDKKLLVRPFKNKNLSIDVTLKVNQSMMESGKVDKNAIEEVLERTSTDFLLPWPFGQMKADRPYAKEDLEQQLKANLPIDKGAIQDFGISILDYETLSHIDKVTRNAGECFLPAINLYLEVDETGSKDEEMILSSKSIHILDDDEVFDVFD